VIPGAWLRLPPMRIGFAGAGNMAAAMARGWAAAGGDGPDAMLFSDLEPARAGDLAAEVGGETREGLGALRADSDVLLLAVKPAALDAVAEELGGEAPAILSVLAATPLDRLAEAFPGVPLLRVMPNQPVEVRRGVICHPPPASMPGVLEAGLYELLELLGSRVELPEDQIEGAMAVMSCSPAYVALFAEALADTGMREGLAPEIAASLVADTLTGTAELLRRRDPAAIRHAVAPLGGATDAGLRALDVEGFERAIIAAVDASLERFR
jgi:pyrroline-5-carboxylate reductase